MFICRKSPSFSFVGITALLLVVLRNVEQYSCTPQKHILKIPEENVEWEGLLIENMVYVDKSMYLEKLWQKPGKLYITTRPRRFGKSTFMDMANAVFRKETDKLQNLYISNIGNLALIKKCTKTVPKYLSESIWHEYPTIYLTFARYSNFLKKEEFFNSVKSGLNTIAQKYGISDFEGSIGTLIEKLHLKFKMPVVVLIDEYDTPFYHAMYRLGDENLARGISTILNALFDEIKNSVTLLGLAFATGTSKLALEALGSGANNFVDLTYDHDLAEGFGFTQKEIRENFAEYLKEFSEEIKPLETRSPKKKPITVNEKTMVNNGMNLLTKWYDGYQFDGTCSSENVYNPISTIKCLKNKKTGSYWASTATAEYLIHYFYKNSLSFSSLKSPGRVSSNTLGKRLDPLNSSPDFNHWMLLFGYFTIESYHKDTDEITLKMPNLEIEAAISERLSNYDFNMTSFFEKSRSSDLARFKSNMVQENIKGAMNILKTVWFRPFLHPLNKGVSPEEASRRLGFLLPLAEITVQTDVVFVKDCNPSQHGGDVDVLTTNLPTNVVMEIKCSWTTTAVDAIFQLMNYLRNHPVNFKRTIGNPKKIFFMGLRFEMVNNEYIALKDWIAIPYLNGELVLKSAEFSSDAVDTKFHAVSKKMGYV